MASQLKLRRGNSISHSVFTGAIGEVTVNTDTKEVVLHDGATLGGFPMASSKNLAAPGGAGLVGFKQAGTGASTRTAAQEFAETIKLTQYMLAPEATVDLAFSRALAAFTRPGTLKLPQGFFNLLAKVQVRTDIPIKIRGAGMNSTILFCSSAVAIDTMFEQVGGISDTFELSAMTLVGNGKAGSGYKCEQVIASLFKNLAVTGTTSVAIRVNNGYSNTFNNVKLYSNAGGGMQCTGVNNNNINIIGSQIYDNGGIGVEIGNGFSVTITGSDIETNAAAGVIAYDIKVLTIRDSYIERNGATGYTYSAADGSPETLNVKADIHLLSGGKTIGGSKATAVTQCVIDAVQFTPYGTGNVPAAGLSIDSPIFATVTDGLSVTNCEVLDTTKIKQMVSLYNNNTKCSAAQMLIDGNTVNTIGFLGAGLTSFAFNTAHNIDTPLQQSPHNYASQDLYDYTALSGTTGFLRRAANDYQDCPVYALGAGNLLFGYDINLAQHPELKGRHVYFGLWVNIADNGSTIQLSLGNHTDSDGTVTDSATPAGVFVFKSVCRKVLLTDTTLVLAVQRVGVGTQPALFCNPIVSLTGFGANRYPFPMVKPIWKRNTAPVDGSWQIADRVVARTPTVAQPKAFVCTLAGAPGTWVSEGVL